MTTYELNYYPTETGDGIIKPFTTANQAKAEYRRLQAQHPDRTGDAFIRVWKDYGTWEAEPIKDINL